VRATKTVCVLPRFGPADPGGVAVHVRTLCQMLARRGWEVVARPETGALTHVHAFTRAPEVSVHSCHGVYPITAQMPAWQIDINRKIFENLKLARRVIAVSQWSAAQWRGLVGVEPVIIPNGVDLAQWANVPTGIWRAKLKLDVRTPLAVWGKTSLSDVLDPTPAVELALRNPRLAVVAPLPPKALPFAPKNFYCIGAQAFPAMQSLLADCDVYLATVCENDAIQVKEAMCLGKPIVGYAWGGTPETVDATCGQLVSPGNMQALDAALWAVYEQRQALGAAGRARVATLYTWDTLIDRIVEVYNSVLEEQRGETATAAIKCSIVIPVYNKEPWVAETIASARDQRNAPPYEIIVINDGSTDGSLAQVQQAVGRDPRVRIFDRANAGVSAARNFGIAQARGQYITCLDADDLMDPLFLARLAPALDSDPGLGIAYSDFISFGVNESGQPWEAYIRCDEYDFEKLKRGNFLPCCNLFRKVAWQRAGGYKPINPSWEDYELWLNMGKLGWYGRRVPDGLFRYRKVIAVGRDYASQGHAWQLRATVNAYHRDLYPPLVSFIVPCYQHARFLATALDSIMAQTFPDYEVVVVDDGNAPEEAAAIRAVCENYPVDKVRLVVLAHNSGLATARNLGVESTRGQWLAMLDADDKLAPTWLEASLRAIELNPKQFAYSDAYLWWPAEQDKLTELPAHDYDFEELLVRVTWACSILVSRDAWRAAGGYKPQMSDVGGWEDWEFDITLGELGVCGVRVAEPLFYYRQHSKEQMRYRAEANKPRLQEELRRLHAATYRGERTPMCCGAGQRTTRQAVAPAPVRGITPPTPTGGNGTVLVRYVGYSVGTMTWHVPGGGVYRFGLSEPLQSVAAADRAYFEGRRDFQIVTA
jgi:glycosyltransferase involved in cell wall biosynthesis